MTCHLLKTKKLFFISAATYLMVVLRGCNQCQLLKVIEKCISKLVIKMTPKTTFGGLKIGITFLLTKIIATTVMACSQVDATEVNFILALQVLHIVTLYEALKTTLSVSFVSTKQNVFSALEKAKSNIKMFSSNSENKTKFGDF